MNAGVFLSHNHRDKPIVEELAVALLGRGIRPWFDKWDLVPGAPWQPEIERALSTADVVLVCLGPHGLGRVQDPELQVALDRAWRDPNRRVVPVLLPGFSGTVPDFLGLRTWSDLRGSVDGGAFDTLVQTLEGRRPGPRRAPGERPYQGLAPFREQDASRFFGRRRALDELLEALRAGRRMLTLLGASGAGKSSLLLAGLLPAVRSGELEGSYRWSILTLQPGRRPCHELARALLRLRDPQAGSADLEGLRARLGASPSALSDEVDLRIEDDDGRCLLAVDQLEEVFTQAVADDAEAFLANLLHARDVAGGRVVVVTTLRADFLGRALEHSTRLAQVLKSSATLVAPMTEAELLEVVTRPALHVGLQLDEGLARALVDEVSGQPGALPLLEFTLDTLWRERVDERLTWEAYRRLGGVRGAVASRAETLYADLRNEAQREALCRIFGRLVHFHRLGPRARRRARADELEAAAPGQAAELVDMMVRERLLTVSDDGVEIAHETLIEHWPRLRAWLQESEQAWLLQEDISREAEQWRAAGKAGDWLWRGGRLATTLELLDRDQLRLAPAELDFVEQAHLVEQREREAESERERELAEERARETRRKLRRSRYLTAIFLFFSLSTSTLAWWALQAKSRATAAQRRADHALVDAHLAETARLQSAGRRAAALAHLARALRLEPANAAARSGVASLVLGMGEPLPHAGKVTSSWFSADGLWLLTAFDDGTVRLWDTASAKPVGVALRHPRTRTMATSSPHARRVLTASDGSGKLWDPYTGQLLATLSGHERALERADFSPAGRYLATTADDNTVRVWDATTGTLVRILPRAFDATFTPDERKILVTDGETARVWDIETGRPVGAEMPHTSWLPSISGDGSRIVTWTSDIRNPRRRYSPYGASTAQIWSASGESLGEPMMHDDAVEAAFLNADGCRLAVLTHDGERYLWDTCRSRLLDRQLGFGPIVSSAGFSPDGARFLVHQYGLKEVRAWDTESGRSIGGALQLDFLPAAAGFSADGRRVLAVSEEGEARVWSLESTRRGIGQPLPHAETVKRASFSPDGRRIVTASSDSTARVWDAATGEPLTGPLRHDATVSTAVFSADGEKILTASSDHTARLWWSRTGQPQGEPMRHQGAIWAAALSPDGRWVATASEDGTARIWDSATSRPAGEPLRHGSDVGIVNFSADGRLVLSASADGTAQVWTVPGGEPVGRQLSHAGLIHDALFDPAGERVVTASEEGTAHIWKAATGERIGAPMQHSGPVSTVAWSPDGRWIATASLGQARLWNAATTEPAGPILQHGDRLLLLPYGEPSPDDGWVTRVAFSPDGRRLATASADGTARVWSVAGGRQAGDPLLHASLLLDVGFSPDGQRLVTASADATARIWDAPTFSSSDAEALADLAEVTSGFLVRESAVLEPISPDERETRLGRLLALAAGPQGDATSAGAFLRWYFADALETTISPQSSMSVEAYLKRLLALEDGDALREADETFPEHPVLQEHVRSPRQGRRERSGKP